MKKGETPSIERIRGDANVSCRVTLRYIEIYFQELSPNHPLRRSSSSLTRPIRLQTSLDRKSQTKAPRIRFSALVLFSTRCAFVFKLRSGSTALQGRLTRTSSVSTA